MQQMLSNYRIRNSLVAGGLAILGALLVFVYISTYRKHVQNGANLVTVYVASHDIQAGTDGSTASAGIHSESVLRRNVVAGAISKPAQISGLVASQPILAGEQVTVRQFAPIAQQGVLANIAGNSRAMQLPGDGNQLLAGTVRDGDHVDVLANIRYSVHSSAGDDISLVATRVILRNLLVLRAPVTAGSQGIAGVQTGGTSITLAVTDSQAQKLLFVLKNGDWWLALRPLSKPTDQPESVETLQSILGDGLGPVQVGQLTDGQGKGSIGGG